jgi:hypothetical protein
LMMGKSILDTQNIHSLEEIFGIVKNISSSDLLETANEIFDPNTLSYLTFVPH